MTAGDVDHGTAAHHAGSRIVIFLTVSTCIGILTTTGTIDVTAMSAIILVKVCSSEVPPWVSIFSAGNLIGNTDSTAIYIHIGILVVMTVLTAAIDRALDERLCQVVGRFYCSSLRTDINDGTSYPSHAVILIHLRCTCRC